VSQWRPEDWTDLIFALAVVLFVVGLVVVMILEALK